MRKFLFITIWMIILPCCFTRGQDEPMTRLRISANGRYLVTANGAPFFWLGDTGWLLLTKLTREETDRYLADRQKKGFNVIQVMVLHGLQDATAAGAKALENGDITRPLVTGTDSYWDHLDYMVKKAAENNIYVALVPIWGGVVKSGHIGAAKAKAYASFLAERYKASPNIIWMNGGDIKGTDSLQTWEAIGTTLREKDPGHLVTFHPRGRASSSFWFHRDSWLDFNSVQSGHRSYAQDTSKGDLHYGEDNWKYIRDDYKKMPVKPVLDAEPSYEHIPYGLHDTTLPRWQDKDVRRYAYWSVFTGACGFTYGDNSVMQFLQPTDKGSAYGARDPWYEAIGDPGAAQMHYLKALMLSRPYFERIPDETLIVSQGLRYNHLAATRGKRYAFIYTYNGLPFQCRLGRIGGAFIRAAWYNPRNGQEHNIGVYPNQGTHTFTPPETGKDWVLILDGADSKKDVYLFTSFREPATDGLYFLYSHDGYHWTDLGGGWLRPAVGDKKIMRDPSMAQGADGTWHLVWTCGWNGDKGFGYASSKDLIHWSDQEFIPVMEKEPDAFNVWAPEIFYEKDSSQFIVIWATTIPFRFPKGQEDEKNNHRLYYTTTKDFRTWSPAKLFYDPGYSVIDATLVERAPEDYVLVFKDNTRMQRNIKVAFGNKPEGPFHDDSPAFTPEFTEGPTVARVGKDYLVYFDSYRAKKYGAMRTTDFKTFTDLTDSVSVPVGHKHGTIVMTDEETLDKLINKK